MSRCQCGLTECIECEGMCPYCGDVAEVKSCPTGERSRRLAELLCG